MFRRFRPNRTPGITNRDAAADTRAAGAASDVSSLGIAMFAALVVVVIAGVGSWFARRVERSVRRQRYRSAIHRNRRLG